jgi:Poxvirus A32 protein
MESNSSATGSMSIRKFSPKCMCDHPVILMVAKRRSGKSELIKDILYHLRNKIKAGVAMSGTEVGNGFYSSFLPRLFVYHDFDVPALERLLARQKKMKNAGKAEPVFVILDDLAFDKKILGSKIIRELVFNGRHFFCTVIIAVQYLVDLGPSLRTNIDFVFCLKETMQRERLFRTFFPMVGSLSSFNQLMNVCTDNFGALVLDNTTHSSELKDMLYWYRAKIDRKPFKIGHPAAWAFSAQRCRTEEDPDTTGPEKKTLGVTTSKAPPVLFKLGRA